CFTGATPSPDRAGCRGPISQIPWIPCVRPPARTRKPSLSTPAPCSASDALKYKSYRRLVRPRLYKVRAAEGRQEIVERVLVREVGNGHPKSRAEAFALEQIVRPDP